MQASRTSILVVRRIRGPEETYHMGGLWGPDDAEILRIEPSFQIILDEEPIGTMEPLTRIGEVIRYFLPPPPIEESSQFEIQAGHHTLRIEAVKRFTQRWGYETVASENQSFDIAPGETVRFFCQYAQVGPTKGIWRAFILGSYKHKIVLQRE